MSKFEEFITKHPSSFVVSNEIFYKNNVKYGFVVSRLLWFALRLYVEYQLIIPFDSELYNIFQNRNYLPLFWDYFYFDTNNIIFCKVEMIAKSHHLSKSNCEKAKINYKYPDLNYPYDFKYFQDINSKCEDKLTNYLLKEKNLHLLESKLVYEGYNANGTHDDFYLCNESDILLDDVKFTIVYKRSFVRQIIVHDTKYVTKTDSNGHSYTDTETITDIQNDYSYKTSSYLICYDKNNKKTFLSSQDKDYQFYIKSLSRKDWNSILDVESFINILTEVKYHSQNWKEIDLKKYPECFKFGSILLIKRKNLYSHACVYLGADLIVHVKLDKSSFNKEMKIFQFDTFEEFAKSDTDITEIRFRIPKMNKEETFKRALELNNSSHKYNLTNYNCEHLAFLLATGYFHCTQLKGFWTRLLANVFNLFSSISK
jgi:hypothetical protein